MDRYKYLWLDSIIGSVWVSCLFPNIGQYATWYYDQVSRTFSKNYFCKFMWLFVPSLSRSCAVCHCCAVACLLSHLDPVPLSIITSKTTLIFAPNLIFFFNILLLSAFQVVFNTRVVLNCSNFCWTWRLIFATYWPLDYIVGLHLFCISHFSSMCFCSQITIWYEI